MPCAPGASQELDRWCQDGVKDLLTYHPDAESGVRAKAGVAAATQQPKAHPAEWHHDRGGAEVDKQPHATHALNRNFVQLAYPHVQASQGVKAAQRMYNMHEPGTGKQELSGLHLCQDLPAPPGMHSLHEGMLGEQQHQQPSLHLQHAALSSSDRRASQSMYSLHEQIVGYGDQRQHQHARLQQPVCATLQPFVPQLSSARPLASMQLRPRQHPL